MPQDQSDATKPPFEGRPTAEIGADVIACAQSWDACVRIVGNVRADELAHFAQDAMSVHHALLAAQTRVRELEGIAACAGPLSAEVDAQSERIAELERNRDEGMLMLQVRSERIAELEATLARVRDNR